MNKIPLLFKLLLLILILNSCREPEKKDILIEKFAHSDFEDSFLVDGLVQAVNSTTLSCPTQLDGKIVFLIEEGTHVEVGDVVCKIENPEYDDIIDQIKVYIETAQAQMTTTKANLDMRYAQLDAQVKTNEVQTAISNLDSLQLIYASPVQRRIKELELQKAAIQKEKLKRKLKALDIINKSQIRSMELQIQSRVNRANDVLEILSTMTIKATQSGMAMRAISWQTGDKVVEGESVEPRMPLVVIPDMTKMKVQIQASESSYKRMKINDPVEYTFDGMPGNVAWGKILSKAPIGTPISRNSSVKYFDVEASIDSSRILPTPGLSVNCKIIAQYVKDTIVVPQLAIFDEDSLKIVYVKQSRGYERRVVKIGPSSPKSAVITSGLKGSEILSMIKPSSKHIQKTNLK